PAPRSPRPPCSPITRPASRSGRRVSQRCPRTSCAPLSALFRTREAERIRLAPEPRNPRRMENGVAELRSIRTDRAPEAIGPYSQAIVAGNLVFTAGQVPFDPATGQVVEGGIAAQTERGPQNARGRPR